MFVLNIAPKDFPFRLSLDNLPKFETRRKKQDLFANEFSKLFVGEIQKQQEEEEEEEEEDSLNNLFEEQEEEVSKSSKKRTRLGDFQGAGDEEQKHKNTFMHQYDLVSKQLEKKLQDGSPVKKERKRVKRRPFENEKCNDVFEGLRREHEAGHIGFTPTYFHKRQEFYLKPKLIELIDFFIKKTTES